MSTPKYAAYAISSKEHPWIAERFEKNPDFKETENRPWGNIEQRWTKTGCIADGLPQHDSQLTACPDFVFHEPKVLMRFFWNEAKNELEGAATFTRLAEGPPKCAHGASICLVFDEILAYPVWRSGAEAVTANLNINLRDVIPLLSTVRFEARVVRTEGRKVFVEGKITSSDGKKLYAEATGLWVQSKKIAGTGSALQAKL